MSRSLCRSLRQNKRNDLSHHPIVKSEITEQSRYYEQVGMLPQCHQSLIIFTVIQRVQIQSTFFTWNTIMDTIIPFHFIAFSVRCSIVIFRAITSFTIRIIFNIVFEISNHHSSVLFRLLPEFLPSFFQPAGQLVLDDHHQNNIDNRNYKKSRTPATGV